ncbi:hypothetical protein APHAL10511_002471 [Amanita phalloides]|nr:hypothetical protein APHAL10511_002471 [Amanita phalloides]
MNIFGALRRKGLVNWPGVTYASKSLVTSLLVKDAHEHHAYFNPLGFHNHLSHHLFAAYDLGASPSLLQKIYDEEAKSQRPIFLEEKDKDVVITKENWKQCLGDQHAYAGYFKFYSANVQEFGALKTVEQYIFANDANDADAHMLIRLVSGAVHPFIVVGYGLEFENDVIVAAGLAMASITKLLPTSVFDFSETTNTKNVPLEDGRQPARGLSVLEILRQVYDSDILKPPLPYDPDSLLSEKIKNAISDGRAEEIKRILSQFEVDTNSGDQEFDAKAEEIIWTVTLLLFATGRPGRKPRLDFFLMHLVTSSLLLPSYLRVLQNPAHKVNVLRAYLTTMIVLTLSRGRPRIDPELLMSYSATPRPPVSSSLSPGDGAIGDPREDGDYNPWPAMIESILYAHDSHAVKTMRTLVYAAQKYGHIRSGHVIGAYSAKDEEETHEGIGDLDGTIFVRSAGILLGQLGWAGHGQVRGQWDRSALGWDDAWKDEE